MNGRAGLSALHFAGVGSGIALSAIMVALLGGNGFSWQELWFASGLTTLVLLIVITRLVPRPPTPEESPQHGVAHAAPHRATHRSISAACSAALSPGY